jgi:hypothetical protein
VFVESAGSRALKIIFVHNRKDEIAGLSSFHNEELNNFCS